MNTTERVKAQYNRFPYPYVDPQNETQKLHRPAVDHLAKINHYCFRGRQRFNNHFRVLVAGGGTGSSTIYLAEQLRDTQAEIVYLDFSDTARDVAQARAAQRNLCNIQWHQGSLLDLAKMGLSDFDYISCTGVLHHLEDPAAGLRALLAVLKEDGALGLMVYGKIGRTGIYQMQDLMRLGTQANDNMETKLQILKATLPNLPATNWWKLGTSAGIAPVTQANDAELYDLFLHACDRAYTVPELYDFLAAAGLTLVSFAGLGCESDLGYQPETYIQDPVLLDCIQSLPLREQQAYTELFCGQHLRHTFYASRHTDTVARFSMDAIPSFSLPLTVDSMQRQLSQATGPHLTMTIGDQTLKIPRRPQEIALLAAIDNQRTVQEIIATATQQWHNSAPAPSVLMQSLEQLCQALTSLNLLFLRH